MSVTHQSCDQQLLSHYYDGELAPDQHERVARHLEGCPHCRRELAALEQVSAGVAASVQAAADKAPLDGLEARVLTAIRDREQAAGGGAWLKGLLAPRLLVPAAAAIIALITVGVSLRMPDAVVEPSAIVESFSGSVSTVMIVETPETRQTILWFEEEITGEEEHEQDNQGHTADAHSGNDGLRGKPVLGRV